MAASAVVVAIASVVIPVACAVGAAVTVDPSQTVSELSINRLLQVDKDDGIRLDRLDRMDAAGSSKERVVAGLLNDKVDSGLFSESVVKGLSIEMVGAGLL